VTDPAGSGRVAAGAERNLVDSDEERAPRPIGPPRERILSGMPNGRAGPLHIELVGRGSRLRELRNQIDLLAPLSTNVLVTGETGTGKGLAARHLHALGGAADRPFVHVDCSALSPSLIESELFGHERGAFTGAAASRPGRFELAENGTIFLDEIGELPLDLQVKLLRVLQDRTFERVGGTVGRTMRARVVAATHRDLPAAVSAGRFRADLFFRLSVVELSVPALRDCTEDLPEISCALLERLAVRLAVEAPVLPDWIHERFAAHPWPGNVRELMNVLEGILIFGRLGPIRPEAVERVLARSLAVARAAPVPAAIAETCEIEAALRSSGGNVSRAARRLGVSRTTLRYRIQRRALGHLIPQD
jgi:DNA-binding NtrC family response regulator